MPEKPVLYRKRLIPAECIRLDRDEILLETPQVLVTRWHTIHPKKELYHGISCFLLDKGWKVSQFLDREDHLIYWYCDIIDYTYDPTARTYVFTDLLADVLIYPNGEVHVVDLDEIAEATEQKLLTPEQTCSCMRKLDALLKVIYRKELLPSLEPYWTLASRQA